MDKLVFMHLPKTGGTTLHNLLSKNFNPEDICSERHNKLDTIEKFKLKSWIFFSGHYDLNSINQNISEPKKIITILREPKSRILSAYYFAKSHKQWFIDKYPEFSKSPNCYKIHGMNYKAAKENKLNGTNSSALWECGMRSSSNLPPPPKTMSGKKKKNSTGRMFFI